MSESRSGPRDPAPDEIAGAGPPFWCRVCARRIQQFQSRCGICGAPPWQLRNVSSLLLERRRIAPVQEALERIRRASRRTFGPDSPDPPPGAME